MALLETYLTFNGNCAEALRFYERTLGGKIEMMMTFADAPDADQYPPEAGKQIMHASLRHRRPRADGLRHDARPAVRRHDRLLALARLRHRR